MLEVRSLNKSYEKFRLKDVSFSLEPGYIMGFIGRNGAGKTTTLKAMMNLVHPEGGSVEMFGREFREQEEQCKQDVGFMLGGVNYYPKKRLSVIGKVVRRFYENWDDRAYLGYLERFGLDQSKRVDQLSQGMKVKFSLALALSHQAKLLILDEPTSGLDPVSRDDLLELFQELIESGERSILFSTHITSDLEKCADYITYIQNGEIVASKAKDDFLEEYRAARGPLERLHPEVEAKLIGIKENAFGFTALVRREDLPIDGIELAKADLETVMVHMEKEAQHEQPAL